MIGVIVICVICAIGFANYMFLRHDKENMKKEERRNEKMDRLMELLRKRGDKNETPGG